MFVARRFRLLANLPIGPRLAVFLTATQAVLALIALILCFRAGTSPFACLLLPVGFALARTAVDAAFRSRLISLWDSFVHFRRLGESLPWQAALLFVFLPALLLLLSSNRTLGTGDTWPVVPTASSLVMEGNW